MSRKPTLPDPPPAPEGLSEKSLALWRSVVPGRLRSIEACAAVEQALRALDRAEAARAQIETAGMVSRTESTAVVHANPLVKIERESRQQFLRAWESLGLDWNQQIDGRIDGQIGRAW